MSFSFLLTIYCFGHTLFYFFFLSSIIPKTLCCPLYPILLFILPSLLMSLTFFFCYYCRNCSRFFLKLFLSLRRSFLTSTDKENMFTLDHFPVWYRRASEYPAGQFLYYMPRQDTKGRGHTFYGTNTHSRTHKTLFELFYFQFSQPCLAGSAKNLCDRLISL